jgi:hypothetical protein
VVEAIEVEARSSSSGSVSEKDSRPASSVSSQLEGSSTMEKIAFGI